MEALTQAVAITTGVIAQRLGQPIHRVEYVIRSRRIRPFGVAGRLRIFDEDAVTRIADVLDRIEAKLAEEPVDLQCPVHQGARP